MSLFGEDDLPSRSRSSGLFDDEPKSGRKQGSSLFSDEFDDSGDSPWQFPVPKKAGRSSLVKNLLPASDVPDSYIDAFDALIALGDGSGNGVSVGGVKKILRDSGVGADEQAKILETVLPGGENVTSEVGRGEFNVLLALIGLAQKGEDITLDSVDEHRKNLPEPSLSILNPKSPIQPPAEPTPPPTESQPPPPTPPAQTTAQPAPSPEPPRRMQRQSFGFPESDPWASPELHKGHNHPNPISGSAQSNGMAYPSSATPVRTTSAFTTSSDRPSSSLAGTNDIGNVSSSATSDAAWGGFGASPSGGGAAGFSNPGIGGGGFGSGGDEGAGGPSGLGRSIGANRAISNGVEEVVTVTTLPEKEGVFLFQHRNYQVASSRRNSKVIRRYSDFVWLLDCLHKKYPFRQLPLLPPKSVAVNGRHLTSDANFVEKRRKGLARFANALVRHPVLSQEQLVVMFLTVPTELAVWRKQASVSVQEEFTGKILPPGLEDSLPPTLNDLFDQVRSGIRRSSEVYINLSNLTERLIKRNEGVAADYLRFSQALQTLVDASVDVYAVDTNDVPLLNDGLTSTAKHLSAGQALLQDEAKAWEEGVLEDMKQQRDSLVSMRDLFDRRDRLAKDNIPYLEKRIQTNENKLGVIRAKPDSQQRPGEAEKIEEAIVRDKQSIVNQHARGVFIKECIRDELLNFQQSQYHVSRLHQDWSQERVKYAELLADNWRALNEEVEAMPLGD